MNDFDEKIQILSKEVVCRHCAGTGQQYNLQCSFCAGTGKMLVARFERTGATQRGAYEIEFTGTKECVWRETNEAWSTSCGDLFTINDGTPEDNGMFFCHRCGRQLVVKKG